MTIKVVCKGYNFCYKKTNMALQLVLFLFGYSAYAQSSEAKLVSDVAPQSEKKATSDAKDNDTQILIENDNSIIRKHNPADPCDRGLDHHSYALSWYDETQIFVNSQFCEPALWFDNFFGSDRIFEEGVAGTYVRWRNEFVFDEEERFKFDSNISFSVELPGVEDRLRLTFESDVDETLRDIAPDSQPSTNTLGLQLDLTESSRSKFNVRISLSPKILLRYRYTYPVLPSVTLRFTQEVERKKTVHSGRTQFDFEKLFENQLFFRAASEAKISEEFNGVDWLQAFILYHRANKKTSLSYEASASGVTEPLAITTNYRLGVRFRQNFHRRWLFYEVAPEVTWPITFDEQRREILKSRRSKWQIFFRLEVHFGNARKKRYEDYN